MLGGGGKKPRGKGFVRYFKRKWILYQTVAAAFSSREPLSASLEDALTSEFQVMGIEGRDKLKALDAGAVALSGQLGKTVQRLRKAYNLSLSELSELSGVAKSIISQIERNETNPTLATIWRLSQALDVSIDRVLRENDDSPFIEKISRGDTPILMSDDGKCRLAITGWIKTVEWLQCYDFSAEPGGVLESEAHQRGAVECLTATEGELRVEIGGEAEILRAGETLRYRADRPHLIRNAGDAPARAVMICILKAAAME
jgi:transcriptional regulator with XRE-family HTH domain